MRKELINSADSYDVYFKSLLDLVPSQFYFTQEDQQKLKNDRVKRYLKENKLKKARGKNAVPGGRLNEMTRYDPNAQMTSALQQQLATLDSHSVEKYSPSNSKVAKQTKGKNKSHVTGKDKLHAPTKKLQLLQNGNLDEARAKLRKKIDDKRQQRMRNLSPQEYHEKIQARRKETKEQIKLLRQAKKSHISVEKQTAKAESKLSSSAEMHEHHNTEKVQPLYSKFEFTGQRVEAVKSIPKSQYKQLYNKITQENDELEELKKTDSTKAKVLIEKKAWSKALDQSQGVKVKDDPALIKKTVKRMENRKKKSTREWKERLNDVEQRKKRTQEKRNSNLDARKQAKKDNKIKTAKKKGRLLKSDFS